MPIYEYQCVDCGQRIERLQRIDDPAPAACEVCGGSMTRQVSAPAFQFKGTGWYVTDYANRTGPEGKEAESKESESKGSESNGQKESTQASSSGDKSTKSAPDSTKKEAPAKAAKTSAKTAGASD